MKFKHNKKRNTGLLYEYLVKELTRSVLKEDATSKEKAVSILKEFFKKGSVLSRELSIYNSISSLSSITETHAEKVLTESTKQFEKLSKEGLFEEQTKLIKEINTSFSKDVFTSFVPQYKSLATIYQFLNLDVSPKSRVLLEQRAIDMMVSEASEKKLEIPVQNNLVFKKFIEKFNTKYGSSLMKEQRELLGKYINSSFDESDLELKVYVSEELGRIKEIIETIKEVPAFQEKASKIFEVIEGFKKKSLDVEMIHNVLNLQQLASEIGPTND